MAFAPRSTTSFGALMMASAFCTSRPGVGSSAALGGVGDELGILDHLVDGGAERRNAVLRHLGGASSARPIAAPAEAKPMPAVAHGVSLVDLLVFAAHAGMRR
jgi:hypothetical protein